MFSGFSITDSTLDTMESASAVRIRSTSLRPILLSRALRSSVRDATLTCNSSKDFAFVTSVSSISAASASVGASEVSISSTIV